METQLKCKDNLGDLAKQVDWTEGFCWITSAFTRPHTIRLPQRQSLHYETCNNRWIESSHWTNTEGIVLWCVQFHCFMLSAVSGPERMSVWEQEVTKQSNDVCKFYYILKIKWFLLNTNFTIIMYTFFWDTLYIYIIFFSFIFMFVDEFNPSVMLSFIHIFL